MPPTKRPLKREIGDLLRSLTGAMAAEIFIAYGHQAGQHIPMAIAFVWSWIAAHLALKLG